MAPSGKKPNMSMILGIGGKPPREQAPPPFEDPAAESAEPMPETGEGACSITCPKCGEMLDLMVQPAPEIAEPEAAEPMPGQGVE